MTDASRAGWPQIPGYVLEGELGRGTSGVVYRARQVSVDRVVALKVLHAGRVSGTKNVRRLQREARIAAQLAHPNLVSAFDMGETSGHWWLAMELIEGPSLADRLIKGGRLREPDALHLFEQLCSALQHASEKGIVHRDIKPANILLQRPDYPRLVDLGLARIDDDPMLTSSGATLGTPHYISPEQARDPGTVDVRSDLWSLGATMYHAVCGQPPFSGTSTAEILSDVLYGPIPDPLELRPDLSKGLSLVLRKCLSRDPDRRYFTPDELRQDLERVRAHKAPHVRRAELEPLDPTQAERGLPRLLLVAAGVVLVAVLAAWQPWRSAEAPPQPGPNGAGVAQGEWPPLVEFEAKLAAGGGIAALQADLTELRTRLPEGQGARWEAANTELRQRLQQALFALWSQSTKDFDALRDSHDFGGAATLVNEGLRERLFEATGFQPETLPREHDRASFARRVENLRRELSASRESAQRKIESGVEVYVRRILLPEAEELRRTGAWSAARARLDASLESLWLVAEVDVRGFARADLEASLAPLAAELARRGAELDEAWRAVDAELLADVEAASVRQRARIEGGETDGVVEAFDAELDALLERRGLERTELARAPETTTLDGFEALRVELMDLADETAQSVAAARLAGLEELAVDFYRRRDYEGAIEFWGSRIDEPTLAAVRDTLAVRLEGAQELLAFLRRAGQGIARLEGSDVSLRQGSIKVSGRVVLRGAPWEMGFRLRISGTSTRDYLLRASQSADGEVLGHEGVERFATEGADEGGDLGLLLQRALFRYHEGDFEGASELLQLEGLQGGELILYDLGLRVSTELGREKELGARRREHALREVQRLTGPDAEALEPKQRAVEIGRLLREYKDVLDDALESSLLRQRARLQRTLPPSTIEDFRARYRPAEVSFPQFGRVRLRFTFQAASAGTWSSGSWTFAGGDGWTSLPLPDLEAFLVSEGPSLELTDPLLVDGGPVELEVELYQPKDSPPDLFVASALGFHVAFAGPRGGEPPRVLADTTSLSDVARRVRQGEGETFRGLVPEEEHRIVVRLSRGSGRVVTTVDGEQVDSRLCLRPSRDGADRRRLVLRSIEPLELRAVSLTGDRR